MDGVSPEIKKLAPVILAEIKKASSILLHCHPKPDPDSVGSALAMKFALQELGKKVTVIQGESNIPLAFAHFPGAKEILAKSFGQIDEKGFDLFIVLDSSKADRVSPSFPQKEHPGLRVVNIDHHRSNEMFGDINLVESSSPATAQILFDLFSEWGLKLTPEMAANLFIGIYTDTGGLKYRGTTPRSFEIMSTLTKTYPDFNGMIEPMECSNMPGALAFLGYAMSHIETFLGGKLAMTCVPFGFFKDLGVTEADLGGVQVSPLLRTVVGWDIDVGLVESQPKQIKVGLRTRDDKKYDLSILAVALGGGGHKSAAGANISGMSMDEAKKLVVSKAKELYNL